MPARLEFDLRFNRPEAPRRRREGNPMRLLLLGNFSGRAAWVADDAAAEPHWALHRVDIDNLDEVVRRIAPQVPSPASGGAPAAVLDIESLDDFHPDLVQPEGDVQLLISPEDHSRHLLTIA